MTYNGEFLFPPRPEQKIAPQLLSFYERRGWIAQVKKNGTCTVIAAKGGDVRFWTRHGDAHKLWTPKQEHIDLFAGSRNWTVLVAELLHSKVPGIRDHLHLFDILVLDGKPLIGVQLKVRLALLGPDTQWWALQQRGLVSIAWSHPAGTGFESVFNGLTAPEDEGLVVKNPDATLRLLTSQYNNHDWQAKCRRPHKNFSY